MKNSLKKGFTLIELIIIVAIIGIISTVVAPKIMNNFNKAKVAKVSHKLGLIRLKLSFEENLSEAFPDLANNDINLKNKLDVKSTEVFSFNEKGYGETDNIVIFRDNKGGWIYNRENGEVYPADTERVYLPDSDSISGSTNQVNIGTNTGERVNLSDWGTIDGNTAVLESNGTTITTTVSSGNLEAFNGPNSHIGAGIGTTNGSSGLSSNDILKIDIDGENINKVIFTLDGLGGYFDKNSSHATQVEISAFDRNGILIETQSSYRDSGSYSDEYSFEITQPVSYFELGTKGSNGTYVVQNVNLIRSAQDHVNFTIQHPDGTTEVISKDILLDGTNSNDIVTIIEQPEEGE